MLSPLRWLWDAITRRFRKEGGAPVSAATQIELRDQFSKAQNVYSTKAAQRLLSGEWTINQWHTDFRIHLKQTYVAQYMAARGGKTAMTAVDWQNITDSLNKQYAWMDKFASDLAAGNLSEAQIAQRMQLYFESSTAMHEQGKASSRNLRLPQHPADGSTQCRTNCKCEWVIREHEDHWSCTWKLNPAEHCDDCLRNAARWNPLIIPK